MNGVAALDLHQWADRIISKSEFPRLLRRLIYATTTTLTRNHIPAGEGVQLHGWDGEVECTEGNAIVPTGFSAWEIGTDKSPQKKADKEYIKRSNDPLGTDRSSTTFVFVTPRKWPGKGKWAKSRRDEGLWRDVRAYDAHDLEQWLEEAPSVSAWFMEVLGKPGTSLSPLDGWWDSFTSATEPPLNSAIVIAGREIEARAIHDWLSSNSGLQEIKADSSDEALAFLAAVIDGFPPQERESWYSRSLIASEDSCVKELVAVRSPLLIVLPPGPVAIAGQLLQGGHLVFLPIGREMKAEKALTLPRQSTDTLANVLVGMGIDEARANALSHSSGRSISVLRRQMAVSTAVATPEWALPQNAGVIVSALLAGAWSGDCDGDKAALETLAGRGYTDKEKELVRWLFFSDPPFRRVGNIWQITAPLDAWLLLGRYVTSDDLNRLRSVMFEVLQAPDPRFELDTDKRWAVGIFGRPAAHSGWLRKGLTEGLVLLSVFGDRADLQLPCRPQDWVSSIIRALLTNADGQRWGGLRNELPLLAEASPEAFLGAVEEALKTDSSSIMFLFQDEGDMGPCLHAALLWALETLAWNPRYLARASLALGALARLDPGGRWSNRPINSLKDIYLSWKVNTAADTEQKIRCLDVLLASEPEVGWRLLLKLVPSRSDTSSGTYQPRWRDWALDIDTNVTLKDRQQYISALIDRILERLGEGVGRRISILGRLSVFPPSCRSTVIDDLWRVASTSDVVDERNQLWKALHDLLCKHRQFPEAPWALPTSVLERLESIYHRLQPEDPVLRFSWLFANTFPWFPDGTREDRDDYDREVAEHRLNAVTETYESGGVNTLLRLVRNVKQPYILGSSAAEATCYEEIEDWVLDTALGSDETSVSGFAMSFAQCRQVMQEGWFPRIEKRAMAEGWPTRKLAQLFFILPRDMNSWQHIEKHGEEVTHEYWKRVSIWNLDANPEVASYTLERLVNAERPETILHFIRMNEKTAFPFSLVASALELLLVKLTSGKKDTKAPSTYDIEKAFLALDSAVDKDEDCIAQLEWQFLPYLKDAEHGRGPKVLHQVLAKAPSFFAELVCCMYTAETEPSEEEDSFDEISRRRFDLAMDLLDSWREMPGCVNGVIDEDLLFTWVTQAREVLVNRGRRRSGDRYIGHVLSSSAIGEDGIWPAVPVRKLIESFRSFDLEHGMYIALFNRSGSTMRAFGAGGAHERGHENRYRAWAEQTATSWPMTSRMLNMIADSYASDAMHHDLETAARDLRFG